MVIAPEASVAISDNAGDAINSRRFNLRSGERGSAWLGEAESDRPATVDGMGEDEDDGGD